MNTMNDYLLTALFTLAVGAGNSVYQGEKLLKIEEVREQKDNSGMFKVTGVLQFILLPVIVYIGYLLAKTNLFLLFFGIILNITPLINAMIVMVANIFVVPASFLIAKLMRVEG